jgi:hypothetical protein
MGLFAILPPLYDYVDYECALALCLISKAGADMRAAWPFAERHRVRLDILALKRDACTKWEPAGPIDFGTVDHITVYGSDWFYWRFVHLTVLENPKLAVCVSDSTATYLLGEKNVSSAIEKYRGTRLNPKLLPGHLTVAQGSGVTDQGKWKTYGIDAERFMSYTEEMTNTVESPTRPDSFMSASPPNTIMKRPSPTRFMFVPLPRHYGVVFDGETPAKYFRIEDFRLGGL